MTLVFYYLHLCTEITTMTKESLIEVKSNPLLDENSKFDANIPRGIPNSIFDLENS